MCFKRQMANPTAVMGRIPAITDDDVEYSGGGASLADMVLGFFEEKEAYESCSNDDDDDNDDGNSGIVEEQNAFWESQHNLLQATLRRSSSLETRIRNDTKQALRDSQSVGPNCICVKPLVGGVCRKCLVRDVSDRLRNAGYNSALCKSKWRSSPCIPSGEHTYIDVVDAARADKPAVRVVIELDFRAEFEMARGSPDYNRLIERLPRVYIGKAERLRSLIKILCSAAKMCMKENKMHMGPWRKHEYMQAKWFGTCERTVPVPLSMAGFSDRQPKLKSSMLTFDLLEKLPGLHCGVVEVV
ncbi:uncharacterized protein LOC131245515 isoform X2 [Magnolia sinica]|uniref:uncharacterized protein LOC131245515 isoform X2 n=1 Tax=Magnolia sinica TaxID=86752 RepID=UPI002658C930|nr:uncharacterized protein LOC131245515 isoform X2 [Magnolia sinica]